MGGWLNSHLGISVAILNKLDILGTFQPNRPTDRPTDHDVSYRSSLPELKKNSEIKSEIQFTLWMDEMGSHKDSSIFSKVSSSLKVKTCFQLIKSN